jgi:hypothetical protein
LFREKKDPIENLPVVETHEELPEGQDPSPSIAAFNESFGTSYRGELLSVSREMVVAGGGASKLLLLWNSSKFVDETGGEASTQTLQLPDKTTRDLKKLPSSSSKKTFAISERVVQAPLETLSKKRFVYFSSHLAPVLTFLIILHFSCFFSTTYCCELLGF